jgi:hypothetical protein
MRVCKVKQKSVVIVKKTKLGQNKTEEVNKKTNVCTRGRNVPKMRLNSDSFARVSQNLLTLGPVSGHCWTDLIAGPGMATHKVSLLTIKLL